MHFLQPFEHGRHLLETKIVPEPQEEHIGLSFLSKVQEMQPSPQYIHFLF